MDFFSVYITWMSMIWSKLCLHISFFIGNIVIFCCLIPSPCNVHSLYFSLSLQKIGIASAIPSKLDCVRLALPLQKLGIASAIPSKLDCTRLALSLQKKLLTSCSDNAQNLLMDEPVVRRARAFSHRLR